MRKLRSASGLFGDKILQSTLLIINTDIAPGANR